MPVKKRDTSFFRPLIGNTLIHAWKHRELWPLAAIAGIAGIGAGINDVLTQARLSSTLPGIDPLTLITSASFAKDLLVNLVIGGPHAVIFTVLIISGIGTIVFLLLGWCQHIILRASHHAMIKNEALSMQELGKDAAHPRILRILIIDAFTKILILNIIIVSSKLLSALHPSSSFFDAFFGSIFSASSIVLAFGINIWGMLALIHIVKQNVSVIRGLEYAWEQIKKHPLTCLELSVGLFAITFCISLIAITGLILIGGLSIPFFALMISQGTLFGMTVVTFCTVLIAAVWAVANAGFSTLITYMSWTKLAETLEKKKSLPSRSKMHVRKTMNHLFG